MQGEILALRHQLGLYQRTSKRPRIVPADRIFWCSLSRVWSRWRDSLVIVQPETVIAWHRRKFREHWRRLIRSGKLGRPAVAKYMARRPKPPSATWGTFLKNHVKDIIAVDFFVVPTVRNQVLFVFLVLAHHRRRVLHFNVTANPTARWTAQQMVEKFPWTDPPKYLLRDRDKIHGETFQSRVMGLGFEEVLIAARSPWQSPFVERLIGSIRRECLDHVIVLNDMHLRRILRSYFCYYHEWRVHQALEMDCPETREVHSADRGRVVEIPEMGGLHHRYERAVA